MAQRQTSYNFNEDRVLSRLLIPKNNEKTPAAAELFFAALHGVFAQSSRIQPVMSFEIVSVNSFIQFYIDVPKYLKEFVEGQLYAQYPNVEINPAEEYVRLSSEKHAVGAELLTTKEDVFPIKTFQSFEADPMSGITSVLSQLDKNDELWIQICIAPAKDTWQRKSVSHVNAIKAGRNPGEGLLKSIVRGAWGITPSITGEKTNTAAEVSGPMAAALKGIEEKCTKLGFETKIRIVSLSPDQNIASQRLAAVVGAFKQYNTNNMNGFMQGQPLSGQMIVEQYKKRSIGFKPYILNTEELASIYHLPGESVVTPSMNYAGSRKGEPPLNLPIIGEDPKEEQELSVLGTTNFRGTEKKFGINIQDRALHIYAIGKTGTGKSTLLKNMIIDDIYKGRGVAVVDPHGDLVADVIDHIPENRINDVIYFSPADRDYPVGFNLFENVDPEYKNIVASGIVGVFKKIFGESWGPRLEYILRNVVLGLLDYPGATLLQVLKVLTDTKFRRMVVEQISDPIIKDFFVNEFERYDQKFRTEAVAPIQNKVGQFLSSTVIRNIVGQPQNSINVRETMDKSKILLIDLSIGRIGEDNSALLGSLIITKIQMAAMSRAEMSREERIPFYLYVDEFQNFATDSFAVILSEARKYGLSLMVTNQYIAQMPETVANAVFGNVGSIITFRVGAGDAEFLNREFVPVFEPSDLVNLDNYVIYLKISINGVTSSPFSAKTVLSNYEPTGFREQIIEQSRIKYSRSRAEVEKNIAESTLAGGSTGANPNDIIGKTEKSDTPKVKNDTPAPNEVGEGEKELEDNSGEKGEDLPDELSNVKRAEDYDTNNWNFLTRTNFRKLSGKEPEESPDTKAKAKPVR
ncbi:MAG: type IV secretion system DNA-binding domain-containing protein [bacterium]